MKIFGRQDLLPLAGLAAAILILFSAPLSRVLSYARQVEEKYGLSLVPALVLLAVIFAWHEVRKRHRAHTELRVGEARREDAERRAEEVERLIAFGQALGRSGDFESIRVSIAQHLPLLAGSERVWVLVREGTQWEALAGDTRGSDEVLKWGDLAEQLLAGQTADGDGNRAIGFPLMVGSSAIGVLGVRTPDGSLPEERRRAVEASTPLLALAIRHAQLSREVRENSVRDALTGLWARFDPAELASEEGFRAQPQRVWDWYAERREGVRRAEPNAGHHALAGYARLWPGTLVLVTQNVDDLHQRAGNADAIRLHGDILADRWLQPCPRRPGCRPVDASPGRPPHCGECDNLVRPGVVWFGEELPPQALEAARQAAEACALMLVIGTSGAVWPAAGLVGLARRRGAQVLIVNPAASEIDDEAHLVLRGTAARMLPPLLDDTALGP